MRPSCSASRTKIAQFNVFRSLMKHVFFAMYMATRLSLLTGMGNMEGTCSSESNKVSQDSSIFTALIDLYSASAEGRATVGCFLDFKEIGLPPSMMKYPLTDLLV